jgi:regulator of sirC expression with transglutaminase-like and TPR domain
MTTAEIKALLSLLDDSDPEVAAHVHQQVATLGEAVIPVVEEIWEASLDPEEQHRLEELVHRLQFEGLQRRLAAWRTSGAEDLLEGMWLVNQYQYPDADLPALHRALDEYYYEAWVMLRPDMHPFDQVKAVNYVLFRQARFAANTQNFHSPANSALSRVLESRRGNPLTLCVIYLLLARRLGLPIHGVNLPNLFILTWKPPHGAGTGDAQFYINAYNRGLLLTREDVANYVQQLGLPPADIYFEPCAPLDIVRRAFRNLALSFEKLNEPDKVIEVNLLLDVLGEERAAPSEESSEDEGDGEDE